MLFLPILGWRFPGSLGWFDGSDCRITCNLHKKRVGGGGGGGDPTGVCRSPLPWLSQFLSYEKEIIQLFMAFLLCTFFMVEWVGIIRGK